MTTSRPVDANTATASDPPAPTEPEVHNRWAALVVLCIGFLMVQLDQTIVNVALPSIQTSLQISPADLVWVVNAYLIAFGGLLLLAGRLGDLLGRRRMFTAGLAVFTVASLACGLASTSWVLIAARLGQGAGGAMSSAVILGMIVTLFPDAHDRARAVGIYAFVAAAGAALGLLLGGALTQAISWHWIFFVNIPIGMFALGSARRLLPRDRDTSRTAGTDVAGSALLVAAIMIAVYAIVGASDRGWSAPRTLGLLAVAVALVIGFVVREAMASTPLVPLRVFASRTVSGANVVSMLLLAGLFGMFFLGALYLQLVLGYDPLQVGLALLPFAVAIGIMSLALTGRLIDHLGSRSTLAIGLAVAAAGMILLRLAGANATYATDLLPAFTVLGIGAGMAFPAVFSAALASATVDNSGLLSGLVNTSQQVGGALGLSVLASVSASRSSTLRGGGAAKQAALLGGYHVAFIVAAAMLGVGAVLAVAVLGPERRPA